MTAEEIKRTVPIEEFLVGKGVKLVGGGSNKTTNRCALKEHKPRHLCVSVDTAKGLWHCNDCSNDSQPVGGSVIDWIMQEQGKTLIEVLKMFGDNEPSPVKTEPPKKAVIACTYDYYNERGEFVYQVVRYEPKDFRQRRPDENGGWIWNINGIQKVLYNLPAVLNPKNKRVWVTEGEKDAQTLARIGLCATTNVAGGGNWIDAYSDYLRGKDVVICGDNDDKGETHVLKVLKSLEEKAASVRRIKIPVPHKDVSDYAATFATDEEAGMALAVLVESAVVLTGGIELPISSMEQLESDYIEHIKLSKTRVLDLGQWLPSLGIKCRGVVPGEIVTILAATGVGKTAVLQNLARAARPLPTLLFEMELPGSLTFERFCAMSQQVNCYNVEETYSKGGIHDWRQAGTINHIWTCTKSKISPEEVEKFIVKAELKMGIRPALVLIDYIQLIGGKGMKRYDVVSDAAEDLKRIAKDTKTVIVIASQLKRKTDGEIEVGLNDAKESGSIENSSGLVLGVWRPDPETLHMRILKNTKGQSQRQGEHIVCDFNGATMTITERTQSNLDLNDANKPYAD